MSRHVTFHTGALIALLGEWWRGRSDLRDDIVASASIEPLSESLAKRAGEALAVVRGATFVDAVVMASAASRGDVVYTSDRGDLERLHAHFTTVRRVRCPKESDGFGARGGEDRRDVLGR